MLADPIPLELTPGPFQAVFNGGHGSAPIQFHPCWVILDSRGVAVATVARGIDAIYLAELLNGKPGNGI